MSKPLKDFGKEGVLMMKIKSDSSDEVYEIRSDEGKLSCTCIGYGTSRRRPKSCKHIRRMFIITILKGVCLADYETVDFLHEAKEVERLFKKEV